MLAGVQLTSKNVPRPVDNAGRKCVRDHGAGSDRILQEKGRDDEFRVSIQPVTRRGTTSDGVGDQGSDHPVSNIHRYLGCLSSPLSQC